MSQGLGLGLAYAPEQYAPGGAPPPTAVARILEDGTRRLFEDGTPRNVE